jgi:hypothetical protein
MLSGVGRARGPPLPFAFYPAWQQQVTKSGYEAKSRNRAEYGRSGLDSPERVLWPKQPCNQGEQPPLPRSGSVQLPRCTRRRDCVLLPIGRHWPGASVRGSLGTARCHPMTASKFRSLALAIPRASESSHMDHPDFRIRGKVFATLGCPDDEHGMVKLTPVQQRTFLNKAPNVFEPCAGTWGKRGATSVHLRTATVELLRAALDAASTNVTTPKNKA